MSKKLKVVLNPDVTERAEQARVKLDPTVQKAIREEIAKANRKGVTHEK